MSDMRQITFRSFLRDPKQAFPLPQEGIHITRRDGEDFLVIPFMENINVHTAVPQPEYPQIEKEPEVHFCELNFINNLSSCTNPAEKLLLLPDNWQTLGKNPIQLCPMHYKQVAQAILDEEVTNEQQ